MRYRYYICDVFTERRFGGNPLAVLPEAEGLTGGQMQQIAREFNFSESTFVLPSEAGHTRRVRIFTPTRELPFAGHPNIGTAFVLAATGRLGEVGPSMAVTFEEGAGVVPIAVRTDPGSPIRCELAAPQPLALGDAVSAPLLASAVSLAPDDIVTRTHPPQTASVGLSFLVAELTDRAALERARVHLDGFDALVAAGVPPDVHLYTRSDDAFDLRTRMFAPLDGVPEDPATGSANCALAGLLTHCDGAEDGSFHWRIAQGVEMGRPSVLEARAEKKARAVVATWIGGSSVLVSEGSIEVDQG
jgi:trans-2,3-dihydro-3-hydroxyanthranilate isomerase